MTRSLLIAPAAIAVTGGAVFAIAAVAGLAVPPSVLITAAVVAIIASTIALLPIVWVHASPADAVIQAGLVGTVLHMMLFLILSAAAWGVGLIHKVDTYAICLLIYYCVSIIPVAGVMIRAIRSASPPATSPQPRAP